MTLCECICSLFLQKGEKSYKIVKARPKKVSAATSIVLCAELFDLPVSALHFIMCVL